MVEDKFAKGIMIVGVVLIFLLAGTTIRNVEKRNEILTFCIKQQTVTEGCKKIIDKWNP